MNIKRYQDKDYILKELSITEDKLKRAVRVMRKRHRLETEWIVVRHAITGANITYYCTEFIMWLKDVYLADGYYLDLEIEFYKKLLRQLNPNYEDDIVYKDLDICELSDFFMQETDNIRIAIHRMSKRYRDDLKYFIDGRLCIKAEGVKWLNEKYYRKSYLDYLEVQKQHLDGYLI